MVDVHKNWHFENKSKIRKSLFRKINACNIGGTDTILHGEV